jgi:hypothetical protein
VFIPCRKNAEVAMEGQFLVRQIYEDEITYNLIHAAVEVLRKCQANFLIIHIPETSDLLKCYADYAGSG